MNERTLRVLEYNKIIDQLVVYADSEMGKHLCLELLPETTLEQIQFKQKETSDALSRIYAIGKLSFRGLKDIKASLLRLNVSASLSITELLHISSLLDVATKAKAYGRHEQDDESVFSDSLEGFFSQVEPLTPLNNQIKRCIVSEEEISDDASPTLKSIRRSIKLTNEKVHQQLNTMVHSQNIGSKLQDNIVTMRNGRYCLPVKAEYKSQVQGMIHDQSATGSTLFIEPIAIVKLNNDLRELALKEKDEIEKILEELSHVAAEFVAELETNQNVLTQLDFIFARAALSKSYQGSAPIFNDHGYIHIKKGRHPLLAKKTVVPIDLILGDDYRLLIVTGPNTGGKTVSLKTVGLFTLMGQAGLHIPAFDGSQLAVFESVYADIGDEQSIEQSLSTFSSHMTNIVDILDKANYKSLVLLDELCAGTDPVEGAALAIAIFKSLLRSKVTTMATTHYSELKAFALSTEGTCNASCEFDVATLSPTYRLLIGIPGKSNAFAISKKLGLPSYIIDDADAQIGVQEKNLEDLITDLETSRLTIEKEQEAIEQYKLEIEKLKQQLETKQGRLEERKDKILEKAREEAEQLLQEAKDFADKTIRDINKLANSNGQQKELEKHRTSAREKLDALGRSKQQRTKAASSTLTVKDIKQGDRVKVLSLNLEGTISSKPNSKGEVSVQMGILKSYIPLTDLILIDEPVIKGPSLNKTGSGKIKMSKSSTISTSLNIIGKTVDEAIPDVDKYLDDAYLAHLPQVTIIHGRGTGALKAAVHQKLKKSSHVKSFRLGDFGEGGVGVTVVEFK